MSSDPRQVIAHGKASLTPPMTIVSMLSGMAPNRELKKNPVNAKSYGSPFSHEYRTKGNVMLSQSRQTLSTRGSAYPTSPVR